MADVILTLQRHFSRTEKLIAKASLEVELAERAVLDAKKAVVGAKNSLGLHRAEAAKTKIAIEALGADLLPPADDLDPGELFTRLF